MTNEEIIEKHLKAATDRAFWLGIIMGVVVGFVGGVFW
jgi:hypothetical protein